MLDFIKNHFFCVLLGMAVGYSLHWCPLLGHSHVCPHAAAHSCSCEDCACDNCACLVGEACGCKG